MAKKPMEIRYEFKPLEDIAKDTIDEARELWMEVGQETAESRANQQASSRGYALQVGVGKERLGFQSARIWATTHSEKWGDDPWFLRFFEYGTTYIPAMPFMRPGAKKANKAWLAFFGPAFEGKIRKARFRKFRR